MGHLTRIFISELLVFFNCIGTIYFNTYVGTYNINFFNTWVKKNFHFTADDFFNSVNLRYISVGLRATLQTKHSTAIVA